MQEKKKEKCITTFPLVNLQQISGLVASLKRQHASLRRFWKHDAIYSCHLPLGTYMGTTTGSLQCFLQSVKRGLVTMLVRSGSLSGGAWSNKEINLKPTSQMPSQVVLLMFMESLCVTTAAIIYAFGAACHCRGNSEELILFSKEFGNHGARFELLGFPQSSAFDRGMLLSASLHGSSCMLRSLQSFKDCCWVLHSHEMSVAKFRLGLFTDFWQDF